MGQVAFVFSGQGDQYPGMGKALAEQNSAAMAVFQRCEALRPGTVAQCFSGTEAELKQTVNTQPCLFAMELAAFAALQDAGYTPAAVAGFSLGEVAACTAAGLVDLETGFRLVCERAKLMQQAAEQADTAMAAVVKLTPAQVEALCAAYSQVYPVNYNCPGQISVAGLADQMLAFSQDVKAAGGRAIPLKVSGGFHSPFMASASMGFAEALKAAEFQAPSCPVYSNVTAQPYDGDPAALLAKQISSPVRWEELIRNLIAAGIDSFVEIGPGKTLTNLIKKIDPAVEARTVSEVLSC